MTAINLDTREHDPQRFEVISRRRFPVSKAQLFDAFADPIRLAQWWGPNGYSSLITRFDFWPGGEWRCVMRSPRGTEFDNESRFLIVEPSDRLAFQHFRPILDYVLTMTFVSYGAETEMVWEMQIQSGEAEGLGALIAAANEQNFDKLERLLADFPKEPHNVN